MNRNISFGYTISNNLIVLDDKYLTNQMHFFNDKYLFSRGNDFTIFPYREWNSLIF